MLVTILSLNYQILTPSKFPLYLFHAGCCNCKANVAVSEQREGDLYEGNEEPLTPKEISANRHYWYIMIIVYLPNYPIALHAVATKEYVPGHESLIGEYNNVAVIMCQQYMDRFPEEYSELEEYFYPQYMVSKTLLQ